MDDKKILAKGSLEDIRNFKIFECENTHKLEYILIENYNIKNY
jgi:hypothetical protein